MHIIAGMRGPHGPKLRDVLGKVLDGTEDDPRDANGERTAYFVAPKHPSTVFPLTRRTEAALVRLGWGDKAAGLAIIADHPAVRRREFDEDEDDKFRQNQLRAGDEILKRFTDAYREV